MIRFEMSYKQNVNWKSLFEVEEVQKEEKLYKIEKRNNFFKKQAKKKKTFKN